MNAHFDHLQSAVAAIIPHARLSAQRLPAVPDLSLLLLADTYPQHALDDDAIQRIMQNPLYWVFCWASGQVLARFILDHPDYVRGKRILDFGSGSGVAGIASAMAGAREVIGCDTDALARMASQYNAMLNGVQIQTIDDFHAVTADIDLILAADVLYDHTNFYWLDVFREAAPEVLLADSRIKNFSHPGYFSITENIASSTIPDLDEAREYGKVSLYGSGIAPL